MNSIEQQYLDLFSRNEPMICRHSAGALNTLRAGAFADFKRQGFPTRKLEKYNYTDVSKFFEPNHGLNLNRLNIPVNPYEVFGCDVPNMSTSLYFVVNDTFYNKGLPRENNLPEGVIFGSLKEIANRNPGLVDNVYGRLADTSEDGITAFNTAFVQDGVFLYVPKNVAVDRPIQIINVLRADVDFMVNRRMLIVLEDGAQACLLACDHTIDNVNFLATQVIEAFVGAGAKLDLYELEETHTHSVRISNLYIKQEASSRVLHNAMTLHNGATRNTTRVTLAGEHAQTNLCGMAIEDKSQHVDNHTFIDHAAPNCNSNSLYKYVLDDESQGAFAGTVRVRPGAQQTNAQQTNHNLCATRRARMYTQPQLEIYADNVKCSHGATVGRLDGNALFYMRSRGIAGKEARLLLMLAFVNEVIDTIRLEPLKDRLHRLVEKRFRGELAGCRECNNCKPRKA
ncbi:MAG: Fe-S cluster assembly protein SufD [Mediterranea sp.]|jgi:Fe-S cluster assembly protein SufD|nr:Fe-S cluster assembly protein SufD [Mediterranea sp.]